VPAYVLREPGHKSRHAVTKSKTRGKANLKTSPDSCRIYDNCILEACSCLRHSSALLLPGIVVRARKVKEGGPAYLDPVHIVGRNVKMSNRVVFTGFRQRIILLLK
jgi:hypothetical protein